MKLRNNLGITLLEISIVVLISGILVTIGLSNFIPLQQKYHLQEAANQLATDIKLQQRFSRTYSVTRAITIGVIESGAYKVCNPATIINCQFLIPTSSYPMV